MCILSEFYDGILERPLVPCRTAPKAWLGTPQAICLRWMRATSTATAMRSINSLRRQCEPPLPWDKRWVKRLNISPFSHRAVVNKGSGPGKSAATLTCVPAFLSIPSPGSLAVWDGSRACAVDAEAHAWQASDKGRPVSVLKIVKKSADFSFISVGGCLNSA